MFRGYRSKSTMRSKCLLIAVLILGLAGVAHAEKFTKGSPTDSRLTRDGVTITCPPDTTVDRPQYTHPDRCGWAEATGCNPYPATDFVDSVVFYRCPWEYTVVRTWTATDACGDSASCQQTIAVVDTVAPVIVFCPPDTVAACGSPLNELGHAFASDNRNPEPEIHYEATVRAGQAPCDFVVVRSWEFSDGCCNIAACQQVVRMVDTEPPVLTCAPADTFQCDEEAAFTPPVVSDNCDPAPVVTVDGTDITPGPGPGSYTNCWFATDRCGNLSELCCQTVVIAPCSKPQDAPFVATAGGSHALTSERPDIDPPLGFAASCHPNPLSGSTTISYSLPFAGTVSIDVFDIRGRRVVSILHEHCPAGRHNAAWNGEDDRGDPVASGLYVLRVSFDSGPDILKKMIRM
jgi:hypothetical protein